MSTYKTTSYADPNADTEVESSIIVSCNCLSQHSMIVVHEWMDEYSNSNGTIRYDQTFDMAFYERGLDNGKRSLWERIKWCFRFLKTGTLYCDAISLQEDDAKQLANYLLERIRLKKEVENLR